jgi:hypothetical protein
LRNAQGLRKVAAGAAGHQAEAGANARLEDRIAHVAPGPVAADRHDGAIALAQGLLGEPGLVPRLRRQRVACVDAVRLERVEHGRHEAGPAPLARLRVEDDEDLAQTVWSVMSGSKVCIPSRIHSSRNGTS